MRTSAPNPDSEAGAPSLRDAWYFARFVFAVLVGIAAVLMLASAPGLFYTWLHRDGYRQVDVVLEADSRTSVTVRVPATGERLYVGRTTFEVPERLGTRRVWYNPDARLRLGATLFDHRIVARSDPHSVEYGVYPMFVLAGLAAATSALWRGLLRDADG